MPRKMICLLSSGSFSGFPAVKIRTDVASFFLVRVEVDNM